MTSRIDVIGQNGNSGDHYNCCLGSGRDEFGLYRDYNFNGVVQRFRWMRPGTFLMGSTENEVGRYENEQQHEVSLKGFWITDTAVTQELWEAVIGNNQSYFKGATLPVDQVSRYDAQKFIKRLNELTGLFFGLTTNAQWEYARRDRRAPSGRDVGLGFRISLG